MSGSPSHGRVAVLTGDLIASTEAAPEVLDRTMGLVAATADAAGRWCGTDARLTRFRGDGWQMVLAIPGLALRVALVLTARLRAGAALQSRVAIGIGQAESLGTASLADARGPAFEASGHALDRLGRTRRFAIAGEGIGPFHAIIVDLLEERVRRWTPPQAEATALALAADPPTLAEIAPRLGITPQAVSFRLAGAGTTTLRRTLGLWEGAFAEEEAARGDAPGGGVA